MFLFLCHFKLWFDLKRTKGHQRIINCGNSLIRIDEALEEYYANSGRDDYINNNIGKFASYCKANGIDCDDIDEELKYDPTDCLLIDFDQNFPLSSSIDITINKIDQLVYSKYWNIVISMESLYHLHLHHLLNIINLNHHHQHQNIKNHLHRVPNQNQRHLHDQDQHRLEMIQIATMSIDSIFAKMAKESSVPPTPFSHYIYIKHF